MTFIPRKLAKACLSVLALLFVGSAPAWAAGIGFRNDLPFPVVVRGASVSQGKITRSAPVLIQPGKTAVDARLPPGIRFITIYDANQPNRPPLISDQPIAVQNRDLFFSIRVSPL